MQLLFNVSQPSSFNRITLLSRLCSFGMPTLTYGGTSTNKQTNKHTYKQRQLPNTAFPYMHPIYIYTVRSKSFKTDLFNPLNAELNPICCLLALLGAQHFLHVSRIRVKSLTLRLLMSYIYIYIYMEHPFLMFLDHTRRRITVGRTPLDE